MKRARIYLIITVFFLSARLQASPQPSPQPPPTPPAQPPAQPSPQPPQPTDPRPLGKYLVGICTLGESTATCAKPDGKPDLSFAKKTPQSITLKQVGCDAGVKPCPDPAYPLAIGRDFYIQATSDSGLPVQQTVLSGPVTPRAGTGLQLYRLNGPGSVVIQATASGRDGYADATPVQIVLGVAPQAGDFSSASCSGLLPVAAASTQQPIDPAGIISLIGSPTPFTLAVQGNNAIFIYTTRVPLNKPNEADLLDGIFQQIQHLAGTIPSTLGLTPATKPFQLELAIAHAAALGDPAARINALNYTQFTVQDIGSDRVRITSTTQPDCATWTAFLSAIHHLQWQLIPEPFSKQLFFLTATDAAAAFTSLAAAGATPAATAPAAATPATAATPASPASPSKPQPLAMASMGVGAGATEQTFSDLLVFSDANPGDDQQIAERKRILTMLDLPRPQMIINAWVMQNSTTNPAAMGKFTSSVRSLVADYNHALGDVVIKGWQVVQHAVQRPDYFDPAFYHYIADRYVADNFNETNTTGVQDAAQKYLDSSRVKLADPAESRTKEFGICGPDTYCLGYNALFQPLKPRLTDFLLTLIAAKEPDKETAETIHQVETTPTTVTPVESEKQCAGSSAPRQFERRCKAIWSNLGLDRRLNSETCALDDYKFILGSIQPADSDRPRVRLACFQKAAKEYLSLAAPLMRAAVADFLFNYKMSQQYPHEFVGYDLSQSADSLNSALSPMIDAFNQDIVAFQTFMRADLQYQIERLNSESDQRCCLKRLLSLDKPSFFDDGLVTVRTISGTPASVGTTSQSVLDSSSAPTLAALANNIASPSAGGSVASPVAGVLGARQPAASLLTGVLNSYQSTFAQVGRQLNLQVTPRSLSTASSAEINVTLTADESSSGTTYSGGPQGGSNPNTSRVAQHDTTTRIRVESVKLFELSSFSAIVERSRSRFPLLPPFVEIPYIGTIAGIPIPAAKEYHSSTAVMSAMVVPTAADIAYGLTFTMDRVVDGSDGADSSSNTCSLIKGSAGPGVKNTCRFRRAVSLADLGQNSIRNFHKFKVGCFSTRESTPYSSLARLSSPLPAECANLTFDRVPRDR